MGTKLTRGKSFGTTEQVTAAKLHELVDEATIQPGAVGSTELAPGAVATSKIAALAVTNAELGPDAVDGTKLADDAVDSEHIAPGAIDLEHFAPAARPVTYDFEAPTGFVAGSRGLVPAPIAGEQGYFLRTDGWASFETEVTPIVNTAVAAAPGVAFHNHNQFS